MPPAPAWSTSAARGRYVASFGTSSHYAVITQYDDTTGNIQTSNLAGGSAAYFESSTPPTNVTDATVQAEVDKAIAAVGFDASAIYEAFLPSTSYSADGTSTSCGGTNLAYCAYHGNFAGAHGDTRPASMPYPSCGGCQTSGFSTVQNIEHLISHETREAVTDADGSAWYDRRRSEADDKCAWTPTPFTDSNGYAYQYEWSSSGSGCLQTTPCSTPSRNRARDSPVTASNRPFCARIGSKLITPAKAGQTSVARRATRRCASFIRFDFRAWPHRVCDQGIAVGVTFTNA